MLTGEAIDIPHSEPPKPSFFYQSPDKTFLAESYTISPHPVKERKPFWESLRGISSEPQETNPSFPPLVYSSDAIPIHITPGTLYVRIHFVPQDETIDRLAKIILDSDGTEGNIELEEYLKSGDYQIKSARIARTGAAHLLDMVKKLETREDIGNTHIIGATSEQMASFLVKTLGFHYAFEENQVARTHPNTTSPFVAITLEELKGKKELLKRASRNR